MTLLVSVTGEDAAQRTKVRVLERLKEVGPQSVQELATFLSITTPAARRHLSDLQEAGLVSSQVEKPGGRGRPQHVFALTEQGEERAFPKTYAQLSLDILNEVEAVYGSEAAARVLQARSDRLSKMLEPLMSPELPLEQKLQRLLAPLREMGFHSRVESREGHWYLIHTNCPTLQVARCFKEMCKCEMSLYTELLGTPVEREQYILSGQSTCTYRLGPQADAAD